MKHYLILMIKQLNMIMKYLDIMIYPVKYGRGGGYYQLIMINQLLSINYYYYYYYSVLELLAPYT
jgi:hypothetical protein